MKRKGKMPEMAPAAEDESMPVASVKTEMKAVIDQSQITQQEQEAAMLREQAWDLSAAPEFGTLELHPWSRERHTLCARLIAADVPAQPLSELARLKGLIVQTKGMAEVGLARYVDLTPYLPTAEKVLYLAAHEPHEFAHVRSSLTRFFGEIADWSADAIPVDMQEEACLAAHRILTQYESVVPISAPRRGGKGSLKN